MTQLDMRMVGAALPGRTLAEAGDEGTARAYARARFRLSLLAGATNLLALAAFLVSGASVALARAVGGGPAAGVLRYVGVLVLGLTVLELPFGWWGRRIEIRFEMNRQSLGAWLWDEVKGMLLTLVLATLAAELVYALLRAKPESWWLWSWAAFAAFTVVRVQL